jgi:hypothetical protein
MAVAPEKALFALSIAISACVTVPEDPDISAVAETIQTPGVKVIGPIILKMVEFSVIDPWEPLKY